MGRTQSNDDTPGRGREVSNLSSFETQKYYGVVRYKDVPPIIYEPIGRASGTRAFLGLPFVSHFFVPTPPTRAFLRLPVVFCACFCAPSRT